MKKFFSTTLLVVACLVMCCAFVLTGCKPTNDNKIRLCEVTHSLFYTPQIGRAHV